MPFIIITLGAQSASRQFIDNTFQEAPSPEKPKASPDILKSLPRRNYERLTSLDTQEKCTICYDEFANNDKIIEMPCKHIFHEPCLMTWLKANHVCPVCRNPLKTFDEEDYHD